MVNKSFIRMGMAITCFSILFFLFSSCASSKWNLPEEYTGNWGTSNTQITVRTEPKFMKFEFTIDTAIVQIQINEDKTASGYIGAAKFENAIINENGGNPDITGVSYIIECGEIGKIFDRDPLDLKEVEIWLSPINEDGLMEAELRYTDGWSLFPMSGLKFRKQNTAHGK